MQGSFGLAARQSGPSERERDAAGVSGFSVGVSDAQAAQPRSHREVEGRR
jgi:hypothetical protein